MSFPQTLTFTFNNSKVSDLPDSIKLQVFSIPFKVKFKKISSIQLTAEVDMEKVLIIGLTVGFVIAFFGKNILYFTGLFFMGFGTFYVFFYFLIKQKLMSYLGLSQNELENNREDMEKMQQMWLQNPLLCPGCGKKICEYDRVCPFCGLNLTQWRRVKKQTNVDRNAYFDYRIQYVYKKSQH